METLSRGRAILTEAMDPRHQDIIRLVAELEKIDQVKEANKIREKAAAITTFQQLDEFHRYCMTMLNFIKG